MSEKIAIQATVEAPRERVWRLWNDPEHITQWNFATDDWHCPSAENDIRVGGRLLWRMESIDGSFGFDFEGVYDEVIAGSRLAFTMPDGRLVEMTFEDLGGSTRIGTVFDAESEHPAEMQRAGWQAILNNFKRHAESS